MPIKTHTDAHKLIAKRMKEKKVTIYKLALLLDEDRSNVRRRIGKDMSLSNFIEIIKALDGEVTITWNTHPTP